MRLGGRIQAAIEVLQDIEARGRPVSLALKDWGNAHRFAGSGDRNAIGIGNECLPILGARDVPMRFIGIEAGSEQAGS